MISDTAETSYAAGKLDGISDRQSCLPPMLAGQFNHSGPQREFSYETGYQHGYYLESDSKSAAGKVSRRRRR